MNTHSPEQITIDAIQTTIEELFSSDPLFTEIDLEPTRSALADCYTAMQSFDITTIDELTQHARGIILQASKLTTLTAFAKREEVDTAHLYRNTFHLMMRVLYDFNRIGPENNCPPPVPVAPYSQQREARPLHPHEELLIRLTTQDIWNNQQTRGVLAIRTALAAASALTSEITLVCPDDFDNLSEPTALTLAATRQHTHRRQVTLPIWTRNLLSEAIQNHVNKHSSAARSPMTYSSTIHSPGSNKASAAACGSIANVFKEAGLKTSLITPTSLRNTRLKHLLRNDGLAAAFNQSGLKSIDVLYRNTGVNPRKF